MKIPQKLSGAALLFAALLFTACEKDKEIEKDGPAPLPISKLCNLSRVIDEDGRREEYEYDTNNRLVKIRMAGFPYKIYTYNAQGKAAEEIHYTADGTTILGKHIFTYNAQNQLTRIDITGYPNDFYFGLDHIIMHYNATGQRIRADFYADANPNALALYNLYTYNQNKIFSAEYDATTTPATFIQVREFHFDNKKSANHALGYLDVMIPDMEKHNLTEIIQPAAVGNPSYTSIIYEYDSLDYPVRSVTFSDLQLGGPNTTTYEYDCQ